MKLAKNVLLGILALTLVTGPALARGGHSGGGHSRSGGHYRASSSHYRSSGSHSSRTHRFSTRYNRAASNHSSRTHHASTRSHSTASRHRSSSHHTGSTATKSAPQSSRVHVNGYTTKDGTYVAPHDRTRANHDKTDNWSTKGNTNPDTGKKGSKDPNAMKPPVE